MKNGYVTCGGKRGCETCLVEAAVDGGERRQLILCPEDLAQPEAGVASGALVVLSAREWRVLRVLRGRCPMC